MLPLWGTLQKSQDNAETIEQAIVRLIGEHEEDPEAHLGEGESLEQHKKSEIIDHPPQSIVPDKFTTNELGMRTNFTPLSDFDYYNANTTVKSMSALFELDPEGISIAWLCVNMLNLMNFETPTYDVLFDISMYAEYALEDMSVKFGISNFARTTWYYGFELFDDEVKGFARLGGTIVYTDVLTTLDYLTRKTFRCYYDHGAGVMKFYVNGQEQGELEITGTFETDGIFSLSMNDTGSEPALFGFYNFYLARSF
jgi:hypothetical protein